MNVRELRMLLANYPDDLPVVYQIYSEQCLLKETDLTTGDLCLPRPDGWVSNNRPDKPSQTYLIFPGN